MGLGKFFIMSSEEYDRYNPPEKNIFYDDSENKLFMEYIQDDKWLYFGYIPKPTTKLNWFLYHVIHGLFMKYPIHKILYFSIKDVLEQ